MGFFDRFKQQRTYTVDEALSAVTADLKPLEEARKRELYQQTIAVHRELAELRKALHDFASKPVPENARSSAKVRERFCRIGEGQLASFSPPHEDNPFDYIVKTHELINRLGGLTERQILHLGVFFRDDIVPVAKKMKEINELLKVTKNPAADRRRAVDMHDEIEKIQVEIRGYEEEIISKKEVLLSLEKKLASIEVPEINIDKGSMLAAESRLQKVKQEIDSLLSVQKLLKRYVHDSGKRDEVIYAYMESSSTALEQDSEMKIFDILNKAKDIDPARVEAVLSKRDTLASKRQELIQFIEELNTEQMSYENLSSAAAASMMAARRNRAQVEAEIRECKKVIDELMATKEAKSRKITAELIELRKLLSDILKAEIR